MNHTAPDPNIPDEGATMNVKIARLQMGHFSYKGWRPARLVATADDYLVTCTGNGRGWACKCPDDECSHLNAVAAVLEADALAELELDSDHALRAERRPNYRPDQPAPARRRRIPAKEDV